MPQDYTIRELTEETFLPLFHEHRKSVFEDTHSYELREILSEDERNHVRDARPEENTAYKLFLGVFDREGGFVGWSWGAQESLATFYMVNSAILPGHRRKGLYSALVRTCVDILAEKGFQLIYSRHCATNNAVIIPKLKAGFIISKMELDDRFGVLIHLHYYTNETRRKIMDYRSGQSKPDTQIKELFKL